MNVIGDKSQFAIEYRINKVNPYIMGNICLWIDGLYIGYFFEEVMLQTSLGSLLELIGVDRQENLKKIPIPNQMEDDELFYYFRDNDGDIKDHTMFSLDESTDDFLIDVYEVQGAMKFIWRLHRSPSGKYNNYPEGVLSASIDFVELKNIVDEFDMKLSSLNA